MDDLQRFLRRRARAAERRVSLEEALLGGRFARYALFRLKWVGLARGLGLITHIVEFTVLMALFSQRHLAMSVALQNGNRLFDGLWWGALEVMRRRIRADGTKAFVWQETSRWLSAAMWLGLAVVIAGVALLGWRWHARGAPGVFEAYALVCVARLAIDLVSRTLYSGVWARQRVFRPMVAIMLAEPLGVLVVALGWRVLGAWAFPVGLLANILISRGLTIAYTLRAYRVARLHPPRVSLRFPSRKLGEKLHKGEVAWAAAGNLTARIGSAMLLATFVRAPFHMAKLDAFPYVLQLAVPLLSTATSWSRVFYHDFKRLEEEAATALCRKLERRLWVVSIIVGLVIWAAVAAVAQWRVGLALVRQPVAALGPLCLALSILSVLQLRELARGGFIRLFIGSVATCVAILIAIWRGAPDDATAGLMLASALSVGAVVLAVGGSRRTHTTAGVHRGIESWVRALREMRGPTRVGVLQVEARGTAPRLLAERWAERLGRRGGVTLRARRLLWFEEGSVDNAAERALLAAGLGRALDVTEVAPDGHQALERAIAAGLLREPQGEHADEKALMAEFRQRFPQGLVASLADKDVPAGFAALPPRLRKRLWRDALRPRRRRDLPFEITAFRPAGVIKVLFAVPRDSSREERIAWRARVEAANWCCAVAPNGIRSDGDSPK
ncbi:MAG TPA: hypothetical protein VMZ53_31660 [Kofleriaceae bacterium]|nr:hypothetical protein [Kofleriaceae bacterium]